MMSLRPRRPLLPLQAARVFETREREVQRMRKNRDQLKTKLDAVIKKM